MAVAKKKMAIASAKIKAQPITITYQCVSGTCVAKSKKQIMHPGDTVTLKAIKEDVTIVFDLASPFQSGDGYPASNPLFIQSGSPVTETVGNVLATYSYTFDCSNPDCSTSVQNPEMIVE